MMKLKVAGRYLACSDGSPFFYLGDTAWELFHRLSREEIAYYMAERARQGFNAVQCIRQIASAVYGRFARPLQARRGGRVQLLAACGFCRSGSGKTQSVYNNASHLGR